MNKIAFILLLIWYSCLTNTIFAYTRQDTLRGSNGPGRSWWDVDYYSLNVNIDTASKSISGSVFVTSKIISRPIDSLQIDLQDPLIIDSVIMYNRKIEFAKDGDVWWVKYNFSKEPLYTVLHFEIFYHGIPKVAKRPPWDGGFIWTRDSMSTPWIAVACQGLGASSWWPCKDYQGDEPNGRFR